MKPKSSQGTIPQPGCGSDGETAVYRLFDSAGSLLYVGMGRNPMNRWSSHAEQHEWWTRAATFRVDWFDSRAEAAAEEKRAIQEEDPECNIHGRPGWGQYAYSKYMETLERNRQIQAARRKAS